MEKRSCTSSTRNKRLLATISRARTMGFWRMGRLLGVNGLLYRGFSDCLCRISFTVREVSHALIALARHRHRSAGYGRHPAGPALRQPFLDGAPAPAVCRTAWCQPGTGRAGADAVVQGPCRSVEMVLPGLLERRVEAAGT